MGNVPRTLNTDLPGKDLKKWRLEHVRALHRFYLDANLEFACDRTTFQEMVDAVLPTASGMVDEVLWPAFDPVGGHPLINLLECFAGLIMVVQGTAHDKLDFAFDLFDLNGGGTVSYDEGIILAYTVLSATVLITHQGCLPEEGAMEQLIDEAFYKKGKDVAGSLNKPEFCEWAMAKMEALSLAAGGRGDPPESTEEVLHLFKLLPEFEYLLVDDGYVPNADDERHIGQFPGDIDVDDQFPPIEPSNVELDEGGGDENPDDASAASGVSM